MASFSQVPLNQTSLSGFYNVFLVLGSGLNSAYNPFDTYKFETSGSGFPVLSLSVTSSGGGTVTYPTVGQLYPYF